jgi:hypothetical protein
MNKKIRLIIGVFLLIIVSLVVFYNYKLSAFSGYQNVDCYQLKPNAVVLKGFPINDSDITKITYDKNKLPDDYVKSIGELKDKIALENLYGLDILRTKRLEDKSKEYAIDEVLASLTSKDTESFNGNEIKPGDKIDIYIYDTITQQYSLDPNNTNIEVLNVKDKDNIYYSDSKNQSSFVEQSIFFKIKSANYQTLINKLSGPQSKFRTPIHGDRPNISKSTTTDNSGLIQNIAN